MNYTLYHGDCLKEMDKIADGSIDAIIADLPYGTTACSWDSVIPFEPMWKQFKRVIKKRGAVVLFGSEPFSSLLRVSNLDWYKYDWVWNKVSGGNPLLAKLQPMKQHENISVFNSHNYYPIMAKGKYRNKKTYGTSDAWGITVDEDCWNDDYYPKSILRITNATNGGLHPTQKPVPLLEYLVKTYTNEGDTVLDCTMGSGTTGVACGRLNRSFVGIEQDAGYFEIAKTRIMNAYDDFVRTPEEIASGQMALWDIDK